MRRWSHRWQNFKHWLEDSRLLSSGFLGGLPAVIAAVGAVVVCLIARQAQLTKIHVPRYVRAVDAATAEEDTHTQKLFLRKLVSDEPANAIYKFVLANMPGANPESSARTVKQLAPDDGHGFAPAHLMRATNISRQSILTAGDLSLIKHHASEALSGQIDALGDREKSVAEAHGLLGYAMSRGGNNTEALPHLQKAAKVLRHYRLPAARLSLMMGDRDEAEQFGLMAERDYETLMLDDPKDVPMRLEFVQTQMFLGKYQSAAVALSEGDYRNVNEATKQLLIRVYMALWDVRVAESPASIANRIRLLQSALQISPGHSGVLQRLTKLVIEDPDRSDIARRILQEQLVRGEAPASVHLMLGLAALRAHEADSARFHLQLASQLEPNSEMTIAALALSYVRSDQPDPDRAMKLIESLNDFSFEDPEIRGIRGQILYAANRIPEAIADLTVAVEEIPTSADFREALAESHGTLGNTELASLHNEVLENRRKRPVFKSVMDPATIAQSLKDSDTGMAVGQKSSVEPAREGAPIAPRFPKISGGVPRSVPMDPGENYGTAKTLSVSLLPKRLTVSHFRTFKSRSRRPSPRKRSGNRGMGS